MRKFVYPRLLVLTLMVLCILPLLAMTCTKEGKVKTYAEFTPEEKAYTFLASYNKAYNDYKVQVAKGTALTEKEKATLRKKKELLTKVYPAIQAYDMAVSGKVSPDASWEPLILQYLDELGTRINR